MVPESASTPAAPTSNSPRPAAHQAKLAADALADLHLDNPLVISSPRRRALVTAELAGLTVDEVSPLLAEWDYGDYEGLTTPEIRKNGARLAGVDARLPGRRERRNRSATAPTAPSRWRWSTWSRATWCSSATATSPAR